MKRTITGSSSGGTMTLGDLRQFVASLDGLPDDASVKARTRFRRLLRSVTVEEDDDGFREYIRAVGTEAGESSSSASTGRSTESRKERGAKPAKQTTSA